MAGDLEDFLKRAAERRQAKAAQEQRQQAAPKRAPRPEYSDRRRERVVEAVEVIEEPMLAEVVGEDHSFHLAERRRKIEEAKKLAAQVEAEAANKMKKLGRAAKPAKASGTAPLMTGNLSDDLIRLIKSPGGLQQAILLREVLERPEHRW